MKKNVFLMALFVLPLAYLLASGSSDFRSRWQTDTSINKVMSIFDEKYLFSISGFARMDDDDYYDYDTESIFGEDVVYVMYINNNYNFFGNFLLFCGGEDIDRSNLKYYNIAILVPGNIRDEYKTKKTINKTDIMKLLALPHRAETLAFDPNSFDRSRLFVNDELIDDDDYDYEEILEEMFTDIFDGMLRNNTMDWQVEEQMAQMAGMLLLLIAFFLLGG